MSWRAQNNEPFELTSVNKTEPPPGNQGKDWVRYEIVQGSNVITGYRQGSLASIRQVAEEIVVGLNERRSPRRGRVQLTQLKKTPKSKAS
jgi:hypothetical protein